MTTEDHDQKVVNVAIRILDYFRLHPAAKDTLEGIANWWLGENKEIVEEALQILIREGVVEEHHKIYQFIQISNNINDSDVLSQILHHLKIKNGY
ncbi:MAG: hypothetical protein KDI38_00870 [Calditrichaeota bacterium]|nr:hypothetical protein [Calditrichota bacterium]